MITADVYKLEPGERVTLYELDLSGMGGPVQRFHGYTQSGPIYWQGEQYDPWSLEATGFELTNESQQPSPVLRVGNIGEDAQGAPLPGVISSLCIHYDDMVGAKLTRRQTLGKYLDAANFPDGNPSADPNEHFPDSIWLIEQKTSESKVTVEFALSSALDFNGKQLPGRQIIPNVCQWLTKGGYRGKYCQYTGSRLFDENDNPVTDPALDKCGGRMSSCKKRFGEYEVINFGGFPSADTLRGY